MILKRRLAGGTFILLLSICTLVTPLAEQPVQSRKTVNSAAALRSLERAIGLLSQSRWEQASFEARLGSTYDPMLADFPYIESLSLASSGAPRADILERVEYALADNFFWRSYDRREAVRLCAMLYAQTCRYTDALALVDTLKNDSCADADYIRLFSLYGLGRLDEARNLVEQSLDRWPFDSRFAKAFLQSESVQKPDRKTVVLAEKILARLYIWEEQDREILLSAVPFEPVPAARERLIRMYRNMENLDVEISSISRVTAAVLALEYGLISEAQAVDEVLSVKHEGIPREQLFRLIPLVVGSDIRKVLLKSIESFDGILVHDANGDGIFDSRIRYRMGRPVFAEFDDNQNGYPDLSVTAELGDPTIITIPDEDTEVTYDTYPAVRQVRKENRVYTLRPKTLFWAPVAWERETATGVFYYLKRAPGTDPLTQSMLIAASLYYSEPIEGVANGVRRCVLENSSLVLSEERINGLAYSRTTYQAGKPVLTLRDSDEDGYFETRIEYHSDGRIASIAIDRNANRKTEYVELYSADGTITKKWDSDEDGIFEIEWEISPEGTEESRWIHPVTGISVATVMENGRPRSVTYGSATKPVLEDPYVGIFWIGRIPPNSRAVAEKILNLLNRKPTTVVCPMMEIDLMHFAAVRTGGFVFVEHLDGK